ncbi:MAG: hypothetical protein J6L69_00210 [Lachnospiraceae bacterium]|nr:hypothetical protein [Lachnospiraceae bacterium]
MGKEKKKKEKITYIDDGRTIADMSSVSGGSKFSKSGTSSSLRDIWRTYWMATKMMLVPTMFATGLIIIAFIIVLILFKIM